MNDHVLVIREIAAPKCDENGSRSRTLSQEEAERLRYTADPRQSDLRTDSVQWQALLREVYDSYGVEHPLFEALHFVRCRGAHLRWVGSKWRIVAGSGELWDLSDVEMARFKRDAMAKHSQILQSALRHLPLPGHNAARTSSRKRPASV